MTKQAQLVNNTLILAFGKFTTQFVSFLLLPLFTYYMSPADFGIVDLIVTYIVLIVPAITLQLEMASFRYLVDARSDRDRLRLIISNIAYMTLPLSLFAIFIFSIISLFIGFEYFYAVLVAGLAMLFGNMLLQITRGLGDNRQFAIASVMIGLTNAAVAVLLIAFLDMRIEGMLLAMGIANFIGGMYLFLRMGVYRDLKLGLRDKNLQREILGYSIPLVPNSAAWWVINVSDRTIITIMISAAANGIYAVSNKYAAIFTSFFGIFSMSWTESASMHIDAKDRDKFFSDVSNAALRMFGALGIGLIAAIPFIFPIFVNASFDQAYQYIPILVVASFFNAIVGLYSAVYIAKKLTKKVLNTSLVAAGVNIVLTIGLVPFFGLYAAAGATALAFLAMAIFRHFDVKKYVTITYEKHLFVVLGLIYAAVIALYYVDNIISSIVGLVIAIVAAVILNKKAVGVLKTKALGYAKSRKGAVK